ncbi:MAG: VOC family protein [Actinomycetota bacterium]
MTLTLDHVYYWVSDMDRAVKFYRDIVGFRLIRQDGRSWAEFDSGEVRFALHGAIDGRQAEPGGATAVFRVQDLDATRSSLEANGVAFEQHVGEVEGYARFATFLDPDGNQVQIIEYAGELEGVARPDSMNGTKSQRADPSIGRQER